MMMNIEIEFVTFVLLLIVFTILVCTISWFIARGKYKYYTKTSIIKELQDSIDILNKLTQEERDKTEEKIKLETRLVSMTEGVCFLSNYCCLNKSCEKRVTDSYITTVGSNLEKELNLNEKSGNTDLKEKEPKVQNEKSLN
jgi:signal transduction histidine kinase